MRRRALTFVALILAWVQFRDAHHQTNRIGEIQESLSNRYISSFPMYISQITQLAERAKRSLLIFCDFPAYGAYSASEMSLEYQQAIRRAADRVSVTLVCYKDTQRKKFNEKQFESEFKNWPAARDTPPEAGRIDHLLKATGSSVTRAQLKTSEFIELIEEQDAAFLKSLGTLVTVIECSSVMPIYFWVRDGEEAVFAVPSVSHVGDEYGFKTEDARLIASFEDLQKRYCDAG